MLKKATPTRIPLDKITHVKELYPRLREDEAAIERYRAALDQLPPIVVAHGRILVDGFHRWKAHEREHAKDIAAVDLGVISDAEIVCESIRRNATHGQQLSQADKRRLAGELWLKHLAHMPNGERAAEIMALLSVSRDSVERWTKDARQFEKQTQQDRTWDMWLDCLSEREIAERIGVDQATISRWLIDARTASAGNASPPASRQHFDSWSFAMTDADDSGFFGKMPPQVVENLLWFFTEPGDIVVDLFAGSGTTIDVAKAMGRRIWASDLTPYTPMLPIHLHDVRDGWPKDAPAKAKLILLDPPYWQQAKGKYSNSKADLGNVSLDQFYAAWAALVKACKPHLCDGGRLAYIIGPSETDNGVIDHTTDMLETCRRNGLRVVRRIIVPYQTQQATGQQVEWARANKRMLKLYRDLVVVAP